jgi:hypothetical protein
MRRDSRDAGKRNSSFSDITSSPESFSKLSIKISDHQQSRGYEVAADFKNCL